MNITNDYNYNPVWRSKDYYFFPADMEKYPNAWCYVVWSRRGPGKTYSALRWMYENHIKYVYMKRTIEDVNMICNNKGVIDLSPYVPINRDGGYNIKPQLIEKGIGGFYEADEDNAPQGAPIGYIVALSAIKAIKGMDMSDCEIMLLDEFIPQTGEIIRRAEGEMLLSTYMTVARDRQKRGREPLKLVLFANAENIAVPITDTLEIIDDIADLSASGQSHMFLPEREILLHHITNNEIPISEAEMRGIYKGMAGTAWAEKAFGGEFSGNDFSSVGHVRMKGYQPIAGCIYKRKKIFVWRNAEHVYITSSNGKVELYDFEKENEQKRFYWDHVIGIRQDMIDGHVTFQKYSYYNLFANYKKIFEIF